jgi:hypothetical protein
MTIATPMAETVLRRLRQLPPREQLRVTARVLPELAIELPSFRQVLTSGTAR